MKNNLPKRLHLWLRKNLVTALNVNYIVSVRADFDSIHLCVLRFLICIIKIVTECKFCFVFYFTHWLHWLTKHKFSVAIHLYIAFPIYDETACVFSCFQYEYKQCKKCKLSVNNTSFIYGLENIYWETYIVIKI